jgi:hypothetical protein
MKTYQRIILKFSCFFILPSAAIAGTMLAGEITYQNISTLTYQFTVNIFQLTANLDSNIVISTGDGIGNTALTISNNSSAGTLCGKNVSKSTFTFTHTYSSFGTYNIYVFASSRIDSIVNMTNSVATNLTLSAHLIISPFVGNNNSPVFNYVPIENANLSTLFISNIGAIDIDGDSLSYQLVTPLGDSGTLVAGYTLPQASNSFSMDSITGDIVWDSPLYVGYYSIGVLVTEWRGGQIIGNYNRDMLIAICQPTTITELQKENTLLNIFPNPVSGNLIIVTFYSSENKSLTLFNSLGERILKENFQEQKHLLNVSSLASGIYLIEVKTENSIITKRIVKQ